MMLRIQHCLTNNNYLIIDIVNDDHNDNASIVFNRGIWEKVHEIMEIVDGYQTNLVIHVTLY